MRIHWRMTSVVRPAVADPYQSLRGSATGQALDACGESQRNTSVDDPCAAKPSGGWRQEGGRYDVRVGPDFHTRALSNETQSRNCRANVRWIEGKSSPSRALPRGHLALIDLRDAGGIHNAISDAVEQSRAVNYIRMNLEFHRDVVSAGRTAPAKCSAMAEDRSWLQVGPTMRALYGHAAAKTGRPPHFHKLIIAALRARMNPVWRLAVRTDVAQGLRMLGRKPLRGGRRVRPPVPWPRGRGTFGGDPATQCLGVLCLTGHPGIA